MFMTDFLLKEGIAIRNIIVMVIHLNGSTQAGHGSTHIMIHLNGWPVGSLIGLMDRVFRPVGSYN